MKKTSILLGLMTAGLFASAQTRMSLYEEFTGENCAPCAATNPGLNTLLNANSNLVIAIKWQVPIPSAPTPTWSLYKTDITEIDARWKSTAAGGYGYPESLSTPTAAYINSAPNGRMDGQQMNAFGLTSNHPGNLTAAAISSAQSMPTPFSIVMTTSWNPTFSNCVVSVSVTASSTFTAAGNLVYRLVLVERAINFPVAPGSNGEKDFYDPVRKSYPTIQNGTALPGTWTAGQVQTFTVNCPIPTYINDLSQMAFVGFIQDDGNKKIWQASRTAQPSIPNDAKFVSITGLPSYSCSANTSPATLNFKNQGPNAITAATITPYIDGVAQTPVTWTGSLASGSSTGVALGSYPTTTGQHTFSVSITGVSGGDANLSNNNGSTTFGLINSYATGPVVEPFTNTNFPPTNWITTNADGGAATWSRSSTAGNGGLGSAKYDFYNNNVVGDADDMFITPSNLSTVSNPMLTFDYAYAQYSNENDKLDVSVSTDCGATWTNVFSKAGTALMTAPATTSPFTPSAAQWTNTAISLPTAANQAAVLVKFTATSAYGNNLYIDNVNLSQPTSITKYNQNFVSFDVYPNPASTSVVVKAYSAVDQSGTIVIYNTLGQVIKSTTVSLSFGINEISLNTTEFATGVYNVVLNTEKGSVVKKLTVSK